MFLIQALINFIREEWPMLLILYVSYKVLTLADWFMSLGEHKKKRLNPTQTKSLTNLKFF